MMLASAANVLSAQDNCFSARIRGRSAALATNRYESSLAVCPHRKRPQQAVHRIHWINAPSYADGTSVRET